MVLNLDGFPTRMKHITNLHAQSAHKPMLQGQQLPNIKTKVNSVRNSK